MEDQKKQNKIIRLMQIYNSLSKQKRDWWFKSLTLEDRSIVRQQLEGNSSNLF